MRQTMLRRMLFVAGGCLVIAPLAVHSIQRPARAAETSPASVTVVRVPDGGVVPDVVFDSKGVLHLAFGKDMEAFYTQSRDGGKTFTTPLRLNRRPMTVTVGHERGPKLALGKDGAIHIVWQGHYQKDGGIWYTRSVDGGKTFAPERDLLDTKTGIDMPTLTADSAGNVIVLWLDGRVPENAENKVSSPLFMSRSTDNGATFGANTALKTDFPGRGCSCCMLWGRIVGDELLVAFRTGYRDIRDMYFLRGPKSGNDFRASLVSADNWKFEGCPMSGPRFDMRPTAKGDTSLLVTWMSRNKVYWTNALDPQGSKFAPRRAFPDGGDGNFPMILQNQKGQILLLWTRKKQAWYAVCQADDTHASIVTEVGPSEDRPSAFTKPDGGFVIVY